MEKMFKSASVVVLAIVVVAGLVVPVTSLGAGEDADLDKMIASAKTAADHEAIAAAYEKMAAAAKANATKHIEMGDVYKKVGGALVAKQHLDAHCDTLAELYKKVAKENETLADAHKAMAKETK
jgi:uncharacterized protein YllA (UPF0747 family)